MARATPEEKFLSAESSAPVHALSSNSNEKRVSVVGFTDESGNTTPLVTPDGSVDPLPTLDIHARYSAIAEMDLSEVDSRYTDHW